MKTIVFAITLLMLTQSLIGCSRPSKPVSSTSVREGTVIDLWASSDCAQPGETVKLRATVTNISSGIQIIELNGQLILDIVFGNPDNPFRRWSDNKPLTPDLTHLELKPGESKTIEMDWVPDTSRQGAVHIWARFFSNARLPPLESGLTVSVKTCVGPLGP